MMLGTSARESFKLPLEALEFGTRCAAGVGEVTRLELELCPLFGTLARLSGGFSPGQGGVCHPCLLLAQCLPRRGQRVTSRLAGKLQQASMFLKVGLTLFLSLIHI